MSARIVHVATETKSSFNSSTTMIALRSRPSNLSSFSTSTPRALRHRPTLSCHLTLYILCFCLLCAPLSTTGEMFTALIDMTRVFEEEQALADSLDLYVDEETERLERVRELAADLRRHSSSSLSDDPEKFLSNPINAFHITKRFTVDWEKKVDRLILAHDAEKALMKDFEARKQFLPDTDDLKGAADGLLRLQDTYHIPTRLISKGQVHPKSNSTALSAEDCFYIGRHAFDNDDFYHAAEWMEESLSKLEPHLGTRNLNRSSILDYLSYVTYRQGHFRRALVLTNEWLAIDPDSERANNNKIYFEEQIAKETSAGSAKKGDESTENDDPTVSHGKPPRQTLPEFVYYEALCRDEDAIPIKGRHQLNCRYHVPHPAYLIGPLKEEVMNHYPRIVVWYDIVHPEEIEIIKLLAAPRLNRATVQNAVTGKLEFAQYRISKSAWLAHDLHEMTAKMNERITRITGLDVSTAEELQVVNYGIGGHYEPHFDFARRREKNSFEKAVGNRIATLLYYLSDVEAGGATVFVQLGVKLWPKKGAAAFWYNLKHNGDGDLTTRHAACPVLAGSKWVMNKWFHERGQEFKRRCATRNVDYEY